MNKRLVKVCGMREVENIRAVEALGIDMMGFILYPKSPRYVDALPEYLPTTLKRVGVFVNEAIEVVREKISTFGLDFVQLHGGESPEYCAMLRGEGVKVIKAISVERVDDLAHAAQYESVCDMLLFDTKCKGYGGSGVQFDWSILEAYRGETPFLLSGGIGAESASSVAKFNHPRLVGYDINSRFELSPALKDATLIERFLEDLKGINGLKGINETNKE